MLRSCVRYRLISQVKLEYKIQEKHLLCLLFFYLPVFLMASVAYGNESNDLTTIESSLPIKYEQLHKAAIDGSPDAQFQVGLLYEYGRDVNQKDSIASSWYEKSAAQGFASAQYRLAVLCDNGWGKPADKALAFKLYKTAAQSGHELAQHDLAIMYYEGVGTEKDLKHAYKWLRIAVLSGSSLMNEHLSMVASEMSTDEIKVAENLANTWLEHSRN